MGSLSDRHPLGIVAGSGALPVFLLKALKREGLPTIVVAVTKTPDPSLKQLATTYRQLSPGQLRKIIRTLQQEGVRELVMIGGVAKSQLFQPMRLDTLALKLLARTPRRGDQALLRAIADTFEAHQLKVLDQRQYLPTLLPSPGILTKVRPDKNTAQDIDYGMQIARQVASWDIGQTVVVKEGVVIAVEAVEGTNEAIRRGAQLAGSGIVVAKAAHPQHDFRFDVPTVGPETLNLLAECQAAALAVGSQHAFILYRERTLQMAEEAKIPVVVV